MSDERPIAQEQTDGLGAAEYVLGVLGSAERRAAQQRLAHDQAFAAEVAFWEERLGVLADAVAPVAPSDRTWSRIARAVRLPDPSKPPPESLWQSLAFWRSFAIGAAALAAASVGALTFVETSPSRPTLLATLGTSSGQPVFTAVNAGGTSLMVMPAALLTPDPRAMQLWLIPAGDKPHSLGLIAPGQTVRIEVPHELVARLTRDTALAVSMEPPGGSPTGQPTGPVIASGKLASL